MEALLVLDVARAQREVARAEHILASCRAREYETIAELYRFKAQNRATKLNKKEVDVGIMRAAMNQHGNYPGPIPSSARKACVRAPDGTLPCSLTYYLLNASAGTVIESASGQPLAIRLD